MYCYLHYVFVNNSLVCFQSCTICNVYWYVVLMLIIASNIKSFITKTKQRGGQKSNCFGNIQFIDKQHEELSDRT